MEAVPIPHAPPQRPRSTRVREVDALRGIAALLVLLFHYTHRYPEMFPGAPDPGLGLNAGYDAVVLFFALSGFSIHFSFRRLAHVGDFAVARFARLFPAYWAAMAVTLVVQAIADIPQFRLLPGEIFVNLTMLQNFAHVGLVDGAYWTLGVELCFYACMAALWRFGLLARLEWILAGWLGLGFVMHGWPRFPEPAVQFLVLRHIDFFAIGLIASRVHSGERNWAQQMPVMLATILYIWWIEGPAILMVSGAAFAFFVAATAGRMGWICVRPLLWVGAMSYPLYLVHQHVGMTIMTTLHGRGVSYWGGMAVATLVSLLLGATIHRWVERPAGDWLLARWRDRADQVRASTAYPRPLRGLCGIAVLLVAACSFRTALAERLPFTLSDNYGAMLLLALAAFAIRSGFGRERRVKDGLVEGCARLYPAYWAVATLLLTASAWGQTAPSAAQVIADLSMVQRLLDDSWWVLPVLLGFGLCLTALHRAGFGERIELVLLGWLLGKWVVFYWHAMPPMLATMLALEWIPFLAVGLISQRVWSGERQWRDQFPILFALLLTQAMTGTPERTLAAVAILLLFALVVEGRLRWLAARPLLWLGAIAYPLFLLHHEAGALIAREAMADGLPVPIAVALAAIAVVLLATLLHHAIERPASLLIPRLWQDRALTRAKAQPGWEGA